MLRSNQFDVIIVGGSYSGLSAALALGRSVRKTLIIDSGKPCNTSTPHSHNFLTQDGKTPSEISAIAKEQVLKYESVQFYKGLASSAKKMIDSFSILTESGEEFIGRKVIFATGIKDIMPDIEGFAECWGKSIIHCPYCHGYEVKGKKTGVLSNDNFTLDYLKMIKNLSPDITLLTNGKVNFSKDDLNRIKRNNISIVETVIDSFEQENGKLKSVLFQNGEKLSLNVLYTHPPFVQHSEIPQMLGCKINENGLIEVDEGGRTSVSGLYACGDNSSMRSLTVASFTGMVAGVHVNKLLCDEEFL
ncbi:NAD(P)/FAD-dependent oxidoreductase [Porifericola rhodea]|uniref:NAD(P)/FAD-dependent oxidoreductase n=1 Tax=Porifericola rhodea TaxID=930972 RepID=UPI0026652362|nr:NAD(P)/FAD-dependent oxidoreductase [Porifericola rhodea]WKN31485.1 NAD(P)/FAD-dependent oxidoreductase [Porifericola rhodea]